jgi:hypothetical protein
MFSSDDAVFAWAIAKALLILIVAAGTLVYAAWVVVRQMDKAAHPEIPKGLRSGKNADRPSNAMRLTPVILLAITLYFSSGVTLWAQTPNSDTDDANKSWTATTESRSDNADAVRTVESHTESGNRSLDKQSFERRGPDGSFQPYQDVETETVQVDAATVRTTTRRFNRDPDGVRTLLQVQEEEKHTSAGGDSNVVRSTSSPDANGNLRLVQRQIEETQKTAPNVEETKTTLMLPSADGGLTTAVKVQERREQTANGTIESQKVTQLPDGNGNWQVSQVQRATTKQEGDNRKTEKQLFLPDSEGKLVEGSRTVTNEAAMASGEKRSTVETYSAGVTGEAGYGDMRLVERATTAVTIDMGPGASGVQSTRTIQGFDANGNFGVVTVDTTKSDNVHAIHVEMAPSAPPK